MAALLLCAISLGAQPPRPPVIPLTPWFRDLHTVRVIANARDTLTLILDTGGGKTVVTPAAAARLRCVPRGVDVASRMTAERVMFPRCGPLTLSSGPWVSRLASYGIFDLATVLPEELRTVDGVLALDAFRGHVLRLDWPARRLTVFSGRHAATLARQAVPFRLATGPTGATFELFLRHGSAEHPAWLLLDSGNLRGTLISPTVLRDSLVRRDTAGRGTLRLGRFTWVTTLVVDSTLAIDGALGTDFLMRGPVILDLRRGSPQEP